MPYDVKRFIFSVSLCAMLAVNPVLATAPTNDEDLDTTHEVYTELSESANGIAGVSYVNRMVNAAGNAAELAEGHAAAAGAHALSAAQSAAEAHKVLADKVSIDQGADNKNKVMVTDDAGSVYAGYITNGMIATAENEIGKPLLSWSGRARWFQVGSNGIADGAVTSSKILNGAVTAEKIAISSGQLGVLTSDGGVPRWSKIGSLMLESGAVTAEKIGADTSAISVGSDEQSFLYAKGTGDGTVEMFWGQIRSAGIADGAVTIDKTAGVVGMVPVGSADATTYSQMWIE